MVVHEAPAEELPAVRIQLLLEDDEKESTISGVLKDDLPPHTTQHDVINIRLRPSSRHPRHRHPRQHEKAIIPIFDTSKSEKVTLGDRGVTMPPTPSVKRHAKVAAS